jgi:Na+/proline symporter
METIYSGLVDVANNVNNPNHNKDGLNMFSSTGFRYGIVSMVVCMGQVLLDQGYYSKAVATVNTKSLLFAYIVGTVVAWVPIPILCSTVFGGTALGLGASVAGGQLATSSDVAPYIMQLVFGGGIGTIMFALMIFMTGLTTGGDILAGAQAICTVDLYKKYIKKDATEKQQTTFGKKMTILIGIIMAVAVMFFEGKSILAIDIFSGIIFAAPCAAFVAGLIWDKVSEKVALASIFIGMATGLIAYFTIADDAINYFVANVCSLLVPVAVIIIGSLFSNQKYDYELLKEYQPDHMVNK